MYISYLYVQTVTCQYFCFPNSQWDATAHDINIVTIINFLTSVFNAIVLTVFYRKRKDFL